jgi:hypothetical protein
MFDKMISYIISVLSPPIVLILQVLAIYMRVGSYTLYPTDLIFDVAVKSVP